MKKFNRPDIPVLPLRQRACFGCKHLHSVTGRRTITFVCLRAEEGLLRGDLRRREPMELYAGCHCPPREDFQGPPPLLYA